MGSSGGTPSVTQTTQSKDPWEPSQNYLKEAMSGAQNYFRGNIGYQPFPNSTVAGMDPALSRGLGEQAQQAERMMGGSEGVRAASGLGTRMIQSEGLSPGLLQLLQQQQGQENPYLQSILNTSNRQIADKVNAGVSGAGRYGSGAHTDIAARAMSEAADPILAQDYARRQQMQQAIMEGGLQRAGQWSQLMPTLDEAQYAPAERLSAIGQMYTDRDQKGIDEAVKRWNVQQAQPWENLQRFNAISTGAGSLGATTLGTQPGPTQPSTLQRLFGGAAAGAGLGSMFGPVGTGVGAAGGGLLGML